MAAATLQTLHSTLDHVSKPSSGAFEKAISSASCLAHQIKQMHLASTPLVELQSKIHAILANLRPGPIQESEIAYYIQELEKTHPLLRKGHNCVKLSQHPAKTDIALYNTACKIYKILHANLSCMRQHSQSSSSKIVFIPEQFSQAMNTLSQLPISDASLESVTHQQLDWRSFLRLQEYSDGQQLIAKTSRTPTGVLLSAHNAEIQAYMSLPSHPNIVNFRGLSSEGDIILDFAPAGDCSQAILKGTLSIREVLHVTWGLSRAIHHCHTHGIAHRDIKPSNILMADNENPMLADFGWSCPYSKKGPLPQHPIGTAAYCAPELLRLLVPTTSSMPAGFRQSCPHSANSVVYHVVKEPFINTGACDVWSLGVTLFEIARTFLSDPYNTDLQNKGFISFLTEEMHLPDDLTLLAKEPATRVQYAINNILKQILTTPLDPGIHHVMTLAHLCLTVNPHNRPDIETVLNHPSMKAIEELVPPLPASQAITYRYSIV